MKNFVECLYDGDLVAAKEILTIRMEEIVAEKLATVVDNIDLTEGNIQRMGRTKLIRVRIRKGKVQRRIKKSAVPGFTIRGGKLKRITPQEHRHRMMAVKRSKFKRRAKLKQSMRKRQRSIMKRKAMGLQ
jgi:hypothetical protein